MILRLLVAAQDRYVRFRYRKYRAKLPRIDYADEAVRSYMRSPAYRAVRYRGWRPYVFAGVLAWMLARRLTR